MRVRPIVLSFLLLVAVPAAVSLAFANPHRSPEGCRSCHIAVPTPDEAAAEWNHLVSSTIEGTCRRCHANTACLLGVNQVPHASGISVLGSGYGSLPVPRTLPVHDGKIACTTCHNMQKSDDDSYRMLRKVAWRDGSPDFTAFCADCHGETHQSGASPSPLSGVY
jgi:hypothetical protein